MKRSPQIRLNRAWYLFYGRMCGMTKQEILVATLGEMSDQISCLSIYNGGAEPAPKKLTYDEIMNMR